VSHHFWTEISEKFLWESFLARTVKDGNLLVWPDRRCGVQMADVNSRLLISWDLNSRCQCELQIADVVILTSLKGFCYNCRVPKLSR
jgi:hypothetical protein